MKRSIPATLKHFYHQVKIITTDNCHQYKVVCVDCGSYVRWATEAEYLFVDYYYPRGVSYEYLATDLKRDERFVLLQEALKNEKN